MRLSFIGLVASAAIIGVVSPAMAAPVTSGEVILLTGKITTYASPNENGGDVRNVARGQSLAIACAEVTQPDADVRVVMKVNNGVSDLPTGYALIMAAEQTVERGMVHVKVPDVPSLAQHTVNIRVFVVDRQGTHSCDAGRVRIV